MHKHKKNNDKKNKKCKNDISYVSNKKDKDKSKHKYIEDKGNKKQIVYIEKKINKIDDKFKKIENSSNKINHAYKCLEKKINKIDKKVNESFSKCDMIYSYSNELFNFENQLINVQNSIEELKKNTNVNNSSFQSNEKKILATIILNNITCSDIKGFIFDKSFNDILIAQLLNSSIVIKDKCGKLLIDGLDLSIYSKAVGTIKIYNQDINCIYEGVVCLYDNSIQYLLSNRPIIPVCGKFSGNIDINISLIKK